MEENKGVPLSSIIKEFKLEVLSQSSQFDKTKIQVTSINRPGLQLMGYYVSVAKGLDVDKPRNLAKSVTVE